MPNKKFLDWIWTVNLWCRTQPLSQQLIHKLCPVAFYTSFWFVFLNDIIKVANLVSTYFEKDQHSNANEEKAINSVKRYQLNILCKSLFQSLLQSHDGMEVYSVV